MSLRVRFALYALAVVGTVVLGLYLATSRVLLQSFAQLENEQMLANLDRAEQAWTREVQHLAVTARDYAAWDDTYKFMADHNQGYIRRNLSDDAVKNLNVNFFAFTGTAGKVVAAKAFNLDWSVPVPLPENVKAYLEGPTTPHRTAGLAVLPDAVLLVASAPIVTSEYRGPVHGSVVIGKFVDVRVARTFGNLVQLEVKFYRLDDEALPPNVLAARDDLLTRERDSKLSRPLSESRIAGYTLLSDLTGQPALLLQLDAPRPIYLQARRSRRILTGLTLAVGVAAGLALLLLLQRGLLRRFTRLSTAVQEIAESGDAARRISLPGRDELARVGRDLNVMLASLSEAQKSLRESEARYARAERGVNDGLWDWNLETNTVYYSPRYAAMLGYPEAARREGPGFFIDAVHPDDQARVRRLFDDHLAGLTPKLEGEFRMSTQLPTELSTQALPRAGYCWMLSRGVAVYDENGAAVSITGSLTDLSQRGIFDPLTGLPNRLLLTRRLTQLLAPEPATEKTTKKTTATIAEITTETNTAQQGEASRTALLFLDLNRFKVINDSLGHYVGDLLLNEVGRRLLGAVRHGDMVARLGGDEFVLLLGDVTAEGIAGVLERTTAALAAPYLLDEHQVETSASIGIVWPVSGYLAKQGGAEQSGAEQGGPEDLLRDADVAMYEAKKARRPWVYFDQKMRERIVQRQRLEADLRGALQRREFLLVYQPIVSLAETHTAAFEVLLRWQHPSRGLISPADFIPLAEETGLIVELGRWVLTQACDRLRGSPDEQLSLAVNLSARQLGDPELVAWLAALLLRTGVCPARLELEVTESAVMEEPERMIGLLAQLRDLGVKLAMDDFGTGYSSLAYAHDLPIHSLKIDRSFVSRMSFDHKSLEIVRTIMAFAERLGLEVVAEGVETEDQVTLLRGLGCTLMQGYYYAKPLPWEHLGTLNHTQPKVTPSSLMN